MVQLKDFNLRDDEQIKSAISRSNVVINLLGLDKETPNFTYEDVHVDAAARIAKFAAQNAVTERLWHVSCLAASDSGPSRRLRTKASSSSLHCLCLSALCIARTKHPGPSDQQIREKAMPSSRVSAGGWR